MHLKNLDKLIASAPKSTPLILEASEWLTDASPADLKNVYRDFKAKFKIALADMVEQFGKPTRSLPADRDWFDGWYPECLHAAAWEQKTRAICLAVEHHDRETPVGLVVRCLTVEELTELSE